MSLIIKNSKYLIATLLIIILVNGAHAQVEVRLYDIVFVVGGRVVLGEIAELRGQQEAVAKLTNLQIGSSLKLDEVRIVTVEDLKRSMPPDIEVDFNGAPAVEVHPLTVTSRNCDIFPLIKRYFDALAGDSILVTVEMDQKESQISISDALPVQCRILRRQNSALFPGQQIFSLESIDASGKVQRRHLPLSLILYARLFFPAKNIKRGVKIKAEDIIAKTCNLASVGMHALIFRPHNIIGWEATRHLSPNSPIRWDHINPPPLIRKGDKIDLIVDDNNLQIKASATALETGGPGKRIWVRLNDNGKKLRAVVVATGYVTLD